jgi:hypothetical protein
MFFPSVFVSAIARVRELGFGRQSRGRRAKKVWKPFHKNFLATPVCDLGDHFSPLAVIATFFLAPVRFLENIPKKFGKNFKARLVLDLRNPFETLAIIVIFCVAVCYFTTSSLLIACCAAS